MNVIINCKGSLHCGSTSGLRQVVQPAVNWVEKYYLKQCNAQHWVGVLQMKTWLSMLILQSVTAVMAWKNRHRSGKFCP